MASIKISHLPAITPGTLTDDDQFVINDANQTTSRLSYGDFKTNFLSSNLTFSNTVNFGGAVTITENAASNVPTKAQVTALIQVETNRAIQAESALGVRIDNVTNGVALLAAPENTFTGNLNVVGVLSQAGSGVMTLANSTDVVRTSSASTTFTGDVNVIGVLSKGGSAVATAADLTGLGTEIQAAKDLGQSGIDDAATADGKAVAAATTADGVQAKLAALTDITVDSGDVATLEAKVAALVTALKAAL